ncbi:MAG: rod shape-determining protein MreC [Candidatus Margulisiibacteriota bacterium]|jgi:rod shape-determining protein MreC
MKFSKRTNPWIYVFVIILMMITVFFIASPVRKGFGFITGPIYKNVNFIFSLFGSTADLQSENKQINSELEKIIVDYGHLKTLEEENKQLKELLEYKNTTILKSVTAKVIAGSPGIDRNILIIDKGSLQGLFSGLPLISAQGALVGKIIKTDKFTSEAVFLDNILFKTTGTVQNDSQSPGLVEGSRNLGIRVNYLPQDDTVDIGSVVLTTGKDEFIPGGLVIGFVTAVHKKEGDFFQSASLNSPVKLSQLIYVKILIPDYGS